MAEFERLTKRNKSPFREENQVSVADIIMRLSEYEDTKLTPEQVLELKAERDAAVADLIMAIKTPCVICKNFINNRCQLKTHICWKHSDWQWRGIVKVGE